MVELLLSVLFCGVSRTRCVVPFRPYDLEGSHVSHPIGISCGRCIVLSGFMEPAFQRIDVLFLNIANRAVAVGDGVVLLKVHQDDSTRESPNKLLTKGVIIIVDGPGIVKGECGGRLSSKKYLVFVQFYLLWSAGLTSTVTRKAGSIG